MVFTPVLADFTKADGTRNVRIYIYDSGKKAYVSTDHFVKPEHFEAGRVKKHPNADYLNANIDEVKNRLQRHSLNNPKITPTELKRWFATGDISLYEFIDQFITGIEGCTILIKGKRSINKGKPYSKNTVKTYVTYTNYLKAFNPKLNWGDITEDFLNDYMVWLRGEGYAENTIAKAVKTLCAIMARGQKHHTNLEYQSFEAAYEDVDTIFLNEFEIEAIMKAALPEHLDRERTRFYLSYNFFLRFGDSLKVHRHDVFEQDGKKFARFVSGKTGSTQIVPLLPHTPEALRKCGYSLPKSTNQEANWKLKELGKLAGVDTMYTRHFTEMGLKKKETFPKYHYITTHTARRSMATNLYLSMKKHGNIDLKAIQLMGGWKTIAMLEKYLKIEKLSNAISAANRPFFN